MSRNKEQGPLLPEVTEKKSEIEGEKFRATKPGSEQEEEFTITKLYDYSYNQGYVRVQVTDSKSNTFEITLDGYFNPGKDKEILRALNSRPKTINWRK